MHIRCINITPRWLAALACAGMLTGCAQTPSAQPTSQWQSTDAIFSSIQPELQQFLGQASEQNAGAPGQQSTAMFAQTPWGKQTEVTIQSRYYAGSGRQCLRLLVAPAASGARIAIACQQNDQWVPVRPVTQLLNAQ
jgi:hypothetical protein